MALALGVATSLALGAVAGILRIFGAKPDAVDRALAAAYSNVPAMAVHKKIELKALAQAGLFGATLDIGCGSGIIGGVLKSLTRIQSLHGLDALPAFADQVRAQGYAGFTASDAAKTPLADESFDSVVSVCVLEHVKDLDGALREIRRVLKPGGRLAFTTPSPEFRTSILRYRFWRVLGMRARAEREARARDASSMQYHYSDEAGWRQALEMLGFTKVEVLPLFSRPQLLLYDLLNFQVDVPRLYFADKMQTLEWRHPRMKRLSEWSTAILSAAITRKTAVAGQQTHWLIIAERR